jgi:hypothetical protein
MNSEWAVDVATEVCCLLNQRSGVLPRRVIAPVIERPLDPVANEASQYCVIWSSCWQGTAVVPF